MLGSHFGGPFWGALQRIRAALGPFWCCCKESRLLWGHFGAIAENLGCLAAILGGPFWGAITEKPGCFEAILGVTLGVIAEDPGYWGAVLGVVAENPGCFGVILGGHFGAIMGVILGGHCRGSRLLWGPMLGSHVGGCVLSPPPSPAQVWQRPVRSMTPCRGSISPPSLGRPPSVVSGYRMPPSVTDIRFWKEGGEKMVSAPPQLIPKSRPNAPPSPHPQSRQDPNFLPPNCGALKIPQLLPQHRTLKSLLPP